MSDSVESPPPIPQSDESAQMPEPLAKLPFPLPVKILAAVTAVAFLLALLRAPHVFSLALDQERAHKLIEKGDAGGASKLLEPIVKEYPGSMDVRIDLTTAYVRSHNLLGAMEQFDWFDGKKVSDEQSKQLTALESEIEPDIKRLEEQSK